MSLKIHLSVKPLSANKMFWKKGRATIKTKEYLDYQNAIRDEMMFAEWPFGSDQVSFTVEAGFSNRGADLDNAIKPLLDTFQGIFDDFNDNKVYHIELNKTIVPKGDEYIDIEVRRIDDAFIKEC